MNMMLNFLPSLLFFLGKKTVPVFSMVSEPPQLIPLTCTDDKLFRLNGVNRKGCGWVKRKKTNLRCNLIYNEETGQKVEEQCQQTCNFKFCLDTKNKGNNPNLLTVGVYYYPWWDKDFHNGQGYLRSQLNPNQSPSLGEYDDTEFNVISKHLEWGRQFNIDLWVTSWWGEGKREDVTLKDHILVHPELKQLNFAIFYETTGRIREKSNYSLDNVVPDIQYLCKQYFSHPNYFTIDDKPVMFLYLSRKLERLENDKGKLLPQAIELMRSGAKQAGCPDIYILGDQVFRRPPNTKDGKNDEQELIPFYSLDGVTNYDVYGSMDTDGGYVGNKSIVTEYYQGHMRQWKNLAKSQNCSFIPSVAPGYNDRGVRPENNNFPLSRKLNSGAPEGSLFKAALKEARILVDRDAKNLLMVNSFNEWHEDTQIEPCIAVADRDASLPSQIGTKKPFDLTGGLNYTAYDTLYLDILKQETELFKVLSSDAVEVSGQDAELAMNENKIYTEADGINDMLLI